MTGVSKVSQKDFAKIDASLQPKTREDGSYRLAYLTATLSMLAADSLSESLQQCRQGNFGETVRALAAEPIPYDQYANCIKHLTCIILYLISYEQGDDCPEWLADFLASCVSAMDQIVQGTAVKTIMNRYSMVSGEAVYAIAAKNLHEDMGFKEHAAISSQPLCEYLQSSSGYRSQILHFALTQDREFIEKRWKEIIAQNSQAIE